MCNQSNGWVSGHHGRGDVETRELKARAVDTAAAAGRMKEVLAGMLEVGNEMQRLVPSGN